MLVVKALPAGEGDALWIEWGTDEVHRMIIDMGRSSHGKKIRAMLEQLPPDERTVELLIVTHVDRDHIEGVLGGFVRQEESSGTEFKSIWFNGWNHLHGLHYKEPSPPFSDTIPQQVIGENTQTFGAVQGELLTPWVAHSGVWNSHFDGNPVIRQEGSIGEEIELAGGMKISILGPTQKILKSFIKDWRKEILELEEKKDTTLGEYVDQQVGEDVQTYGRQRPTKPSLSTLADLEALAASGGDDLDDKPANGSSICIIAEYQGRRLLLTGDAHADNLLESLNLLPQDAKEFDLVKLPHHGSKKNVTSALIESLSCDKFLISTSGSYFYHPDAAAVARVIRHSSADKPEICFNVPSDFNQWWSDPDWTEKFSYRVSYGDEGEGLAITFP